MAAALSERVETDSPELILFGQAYTDRDVAGRLAVRLGVGVLLGGSYAETDVSARAAVHVALATRPDLLMAKPGLGVDEALEAQCIDRVGVDAQHVAIDARGQFVRDDSPQRPRGLVQQLAGRRRRFVTPDGGDQGVGRHLSTSGEREPWLPYNVSASREVVLA